MPVKISQDGPFPLLEGPGRGKREGSAVGGPGPDERGGGVHSILKFWDFYESLGVVPNMEPNRARWIQEALGLLSAMVVHLIEAST